MKISGSAHAKFQASSSFLCLYRPVCVGPVRKPHCWFSHEAAQMIRCLSFLRFIQNSVVPFRKQGDMVETGICTDFLMTVSESILTNECQPV